MVCPFRNLVAMKTRVRVDISKHWQYLFMSLCVAILGGFAIEQLTAQVDGQNAWRRTARGWEYAHSVQASSSPTFRSTVPSDPSALSSARQWHRIILPIALGSFLVTFSCWLLVGVPNRGIIRRLGV